jgi:hypothetical protein
MTGYIFSAYIIAGIVLAALAVSSAIRLGKYKKILKDKKD